MTDKKPTREYGLLIKRENRYGTEHITVELTSRREDRDAPYGCSSDGENQWDKDVPKHVLGLQLDGLVCDGHISKDYASLGFIGFSPEYRDVFSVDLPKLARMSKTLKKVVAGQRKDSAHEPGDIFMSIAKTLKLSFAVTRIGAPHENRWRFMSIAEGRNCLRNMIEETIAEVHGHKKDGTTG